MWKTLSESSGHRLLISLLILVSVGILMGCAGFAHHSNARDVDWRRINAIEASAQRYGAQIIWITLPEKIVPAIPAGVQQDKPK